MKREGGWEGGRVGGREEEGGREGGREGGKKRIPLKRLHTHCSITANDYVPTTSNSH